MKTAFAALAFFLLFLGASAQKWETITYKDLVTFQLPEGYTLMDTLGSRIYQSEIEDTTYICTFIADAQPLVFESEASLDAFYNDFFNGLVTKSDKPKVVSKEILRFGKFRALRASLQRNVIKKELTWEILVFHVANTTLSFQCITQNRDKAQFARVEQSIRFSDTLTEKDQISPPSETAESKAPGMATRYGAYALVGLAAVFGTWFFTRKRK